MALGNYNSSSVSFRFVDSKPFGMDITKYSITPENNIENPIIDADTINGLRGVVSFIAKEEGIFDLKMSGFRLVVDVPEGGKNPKIQMIMGKDCPCINPQDWRTTPEPWDPNNQKSVFESWAQAAIDKKTDWNGRKIFYVGQDNEVFGLPDGDPKADSHFIMLASRRFSNMLDENFTGDYWGRYFTGAYQVLQGLGLEKKQTRYIANFGQGFQSGPRVHMHVLSGDWMPKIFPYEYGFTTGADKRIIDPSFSKFLDPDISKIRGTLINLIDERKSIQGFDEAAKNKRKEIDVKINKILKQIKDEYSRIK